MASFGNALWSRCALWRSRVPCRSFSTSAYDTTPRKTETSEFEDFCRCTSGRWLWAEEARLRERYKKFNVPGLKLLAAKASGAHSCVSIIKLAEGGFNKVFRLSMDNGAVVIARIPNPNIGLAFKVIASEVATMDFVSFRSPVRILEGKANEHSTGVECYRYPSAQGPGMGWRNSNNAESEYILMEEAKGTQLDELWPGMDLDDKFKVIDDVITIQQKLQSVAFSRCGNLYFKSDAFEGCSEVDVSGNFSHSTQTFAQDRFAIGPIAEKAFWETGKTSLFTDRGPWPDAQTYLRAISRRERSKIPSMETLASDGASQNDFEILDSPQARLSLLDRFDAVSPYLPPSDPNLNKATLSHWDLRAPNIFVEDGRITCLIDWQDTWIGPLFMQERRPQIIEYHGEILLRLPDYYEAMEDKEEKARLTDKVERSILYWYYGRETQERNPTLQELFDLPLTRIRREIVLFASEVWDDTGTNIQTGVPCPISFTKDEIEAHERVSADWNDNANFWSSLEGFVSRDGYTSIEHYEEARKLFAELREEGLAHLRGAELADFSEMSQRAKRSD